MTIDFSLPPRVVVIHGVQSGGNADLTHDQDIADLIDDALAARGVDLPFNAVGYSYEDTNDEAQKVSKLIVGALSSSVPLLGPVLNQVVDVVGDVVIALDQDSTCTTAGKIRKGLRDVVEASYRDEGRPLYIVAHSLGSVYSLDVINQLIGHDDYYKGDDVKTWPVLGLLTMGSPLGLDLLGRNHLEPVAGAKRARFLWENHFSRLDPIVSGHVFGRPVGLSKDMNGPVEQRFAKAAVNAGWLLRPNVSALKKQWLLAHVAYWTSSKVGDDLVRMLFT